MSDSGDKVSATAPSPSHLREVVGVFLRLGFTAFGGPAAHVALLEDEVVRRRRWLDREQFLDLVAAVNFIPGPNSTELATHLGWLRAGWRGLIVAGVCFIVPAVMIVIPLAWLYVRYQHIHYSTMGGGPPFLAGIRACMVAIVAAATWRFGRAAVKDAWTAAVGCVAVAAALLLPRWGVPQTELVILGAAAIAGMLRQGAAASPAPPPGPGSTPNLSATSLALLTPAATQAVAGAAVVAPLTSLHPLLLFFLKVGATLFGSGYVLVSYFNAGLVRQHHWMTEGQVLDAIAVGQFTPGPLLTSATFVGYVLAHQLGGVGWGIAGAVLCTAAVFAPSFGFVAILGPLWSRLRRSRRAKGAFAAMNAAVVALIVMAALALGSQAIVNVPTAAIAIAALVALLIWNINSTWLVLAAGVVGWLSGYLPSVLICQL